MRSIGISSELGYIRQDGFLHDYIDRFECLASSVSYTFEQYLPGIFINGLQYELESEVRDGLKYLRVIDLEEVKKLALEAEERLAELDRLTEIRKRRMLSSRKPERSRVGNSFASRSNVGELSSVEEDPWKKIDSILEKMQETIKGLRTTSDIHIDAASSLQKASTGPTPLRESNRKQSENLSNGQSKKFQQLSAVDFQFRRDKGLCFKCDERFHPNHVCHSEEVEHIGGIGSVPEGESVVKRGTVIDEKPSEEVEAIEPVIANKDDDRASKAAMLLKTREQTEENEPLPLVALMEKDNALELFVIPQVMKCEGPVVYFVDFVDDSAVFRSVQQWIIMDPFRSMESVGYLEEDWDFICTMPFKPGLSIEGIVVSALPR